MANYMFDPDDPGLVDKLREYPEFRKTVKPLEYAKVFKYIILMYDFDSPYRTKITDYYTRKRKAALDAGFKLQAKEKRFDSSVEAMLIGENDNINDMVIRYIRLFNTPDYLHYVISWELLMAEMRFALCISGPDKLKQVRENINGLTKTINELTALLFGGHETESALKALYAAMEQDRLRLRSEEVAEDLLHNELDLKVDPYHFNTFSEVKPREPRQDEPSEPIEELTGDVFDFEEDGSI